MTPTVYTVEPRGSIWRVLALRGKLRAFIAAHATRGAALRHRERLEDYQRALFARMRENAA